MCMYLAIVEQLQRMLLVFALLIANTKYETKTDGTKQISLIFDASRDCVTSEWAGSCRTEPLALSLLHDTILLWYCRSLVGPFYNLLLSSKWKFVYVFLANLVTHFWASSNAAIARYIRLRWHYKNIYFLNFIWW